MPTTSSDRTRFEREGVAKGEIRGPFTLPSQAYPGTQHTYWVYVPAQYDTAEPASLMIFNDGQAFKNMDGRRPRAERARQPDLPPRDAGDDRPSSSIRAARPSSRSRTPKEWGDRTTNRPTEYNTLDDKYARVIVDELMPVLYKDYNISKDPERHGIGGASSGAIAAFTVAWERPNQFRKVLSIIGSFTNLRGGHAYPDIVRQSEKKPIRIFLQDGRNDNRGVGRGGDYDQPRDWFYPERPADGGADREGLRRQLLVGHRPPRPEAGRRDPARHDALALARSPGVDRRERHGRAVVQHPAQEAVGVPTDELMLALGFR